MRSSELAIMNELPFLFWAKDKDGTYVWGNKAINAFAGEDVTGKTDFELRWSKDADGLRADDQKVWESGQPEFVHEIAGTPGFEASTLSVCKFIGELDGQRCVFGASFVIKGK